ncbi:MAG: lytic transglycosylase domain-containing protein [Bacteroidales bacterium]|nr:lytic transglycosylase domain-containing protein [Bacteroidales bacterium]
MKLKVAFSKASWQLTVVLSFLLLIALFLSSDFGPADTLKMPDNLSAVPPELPEKIEFAREEVPLAFFDVRESLERELMVNVYWHSQTIWLLQKAYRFFPVIEPILKQNNIPDDFKYLAVAESGLSNVVSPAGATGFWQIMEGTGKDYGLEINPEVDERYHLEKATEFACKYINESFSKYQNWTLAAASYNVGRKGIDRQIERQNENEFYNMLFNDETARYIFRILAFKIIFENPGDYGFQIPPNKRYKPIPYQYFETSEEISSLAEFAKGHNTNYKFLKMLNPWLRDDKLLNKSHKTYLIKIPDENARLQK